MRGRANNAFQRTTLRVAAEGGRRPTREELIRANAVVGKDKAAGAGGSRDEAAKANMVVEVRGSSCWASR